jgi:flagellar assembly protein FliH
MGEREGYARAQAEWEGERAALVRLANSLTALQSEPAAPTALVIAEIVHNLVTQICGEVGIAQPLLLARARAAADLLDETLRPARLCLHPDDAALLADADLPVAITADAHVTRGSIRLETASGSIEDTLETRLAALRAQLNALALNGGHAGAES